MPPFDKNNQYKKFCAYGFLKNLRFFDAFFILFFVDQGISYTQIGILYAVREVAINVFEVPSGLLADTFGRKRALTLALLSYIISFLIFYVGHNFYIFLIAMILYGIGDAFRSGTNKGMIMDYLRQQNWMDQKVNYYGHTRSWSQKGSALSALVAGILVFINGDYQHVFLFALLPYLLNLINIASYPNSLNFSTNPSKSKPNTLGQSFSNFLFFIKRPEVLRIMNSAALHSAFMKSIKDYIQPLLIQIALLSPLIFHENSTKQTGLIIGIFYFFIYLLTSNASKNASKLLHLNISKLSFKTLFLGLFCGILSGLFYFSGFWIFAFIFFVIIYLIENVRKPILTGEMADAVSGDILTSVLSAQSFMQSMFTIFLSILFGFLADLIGIGLAFGSLSTFLLLYTLFINSLGKDSTV